MTNSLSESIARRLRPETPFHLPPPAQPLNSTVKLTLEGTETAPAIVLTDTYRPYTWQIAMQRDENTANTWHAEAQMPMEPTIVQYHFEVAGQKIVEQRQVEGQNTPIYGEWESLPFKIAVYDPDKMPADWTKGMVVYQIFPDRFAKAQSDDDAASKMKGIYGHEPIFKQWGEIPEAPPLGRDFYGGDLQGIIEKLDYLKDLGVECLYLNPIFEAASNHRYEAIDFMKIDQMLGDEADFDQLIAAAHDRDMTIVLDAVFNHCSSDSVYFDITGKHTEATGIPGASQSKQSPYYRWFKFDHWPDQYDGWIGLGFMPEFVECPEMEDYFLGEDGVAAYWLKKGIDGWRADVAFDNTYQFWQRYRQRIDAVKPGAWFISEEWRDSTHYMLGDTFNGTMNYRFTWAVRGFLATDDLKPSELDDRLQVFMRDTPAPALHSQMNLLDSHDTGRALTACDGDRDRLRQLVAFQFAYPGAPTVYYGSEVGLEGDSAEDGRRCFPWGQTDDDLHSDFKRLMHHRQHSQALRTGSVEPVIADDIRQVYGFSRTQDDEVIYALFNASDEAQTVSIDAGDGTWYDMLETHPDVDGNGGQLTVKIQPRGAVWYTRR
jgi:cyclomaltodextrinase / maltogenic alpha-amylase / neopullulanase